MAFKVHGRTHFFLRPLLFVVVIVRLSSVRIWTSGLGTAKAALCQTFNQNVTLAKFRWTSLELNGFGSSLLGI